MTEGNIPGTGRKKNSYYCIYCPDMLKIYQRESKFFEFSRDTNTAKYLSIVDRLHSEHLVIVDTFQLNRPNHGQTLIEKPLYSGQFIADNCYSGHKFKPNYLFIADTPQFLWKNKNKQLFDFQIFLFGTLLYVSPTPLTLLYLVSHQKFHEFPELQELGRRIVQNMQISRNLLPVKLPRNLYIADTCLQRTLFSGTTGVRYRQA